MEEQTGKDKVLLVHLERALDELLGAWAVSSGRQLEIPASALETALEGSDRMQAARKTFAAEFQRVINLVPDGYAAESFAFEELFNQAIWTAVEVGFKVGNSVRKGSPK